MYPVPSPSREPLHRYQAQRDVSGSWASDFLFDFGNSGLRNLDSRDCTASRFALEIPSLRSRVHCPVFSPVSLSTWLCVTEPFKISIQVSICR